MQHPNWAPMSGWELLGPLVQKNQRTLEKGLRLLWLIGLNPPFEEGKVQARVYICSLSSFRKTATLVWGLPKWPRTAQVGYVSKQALTNLSGFPFPLKTEVTKGTPK